MRRIWLSPLLVLTSPLLLFAGCESHPTTTQSDEHALLGTFRVGRSCAAEHAEVFDEAARLGRIFALSTSYTQCLREVSTTGRGRFGPYLSCQPPPQCMQSEPLATAPVADQVARFIEVGRNGKAVIASCASGSAVAAAGGFDSQGREYLEYQDKGLATADKALLPACSEVHDVPPCRPLSRRAYVAVLSNAIWHESAHNHGYIHGGCIEGTAAEQCGHPQGTWSLVQNSAPYIVGGCMQESIGESEPHCEGFCADPEAEGMLADLDDPDSCYCGQDPVTTDWQNVELRVQYLSPWLGAARRLFFPSSLRTQSLPSAEVAQDIEIEILEGLPRPMAVEWSVNGLTYVDDEVRTLTVRPGDHIQITLRTAAEGLDPADFPAVTVALDIAQQTVPLPFSAPPPPYDLQQNLPQAGGAGGPTLRDNGVLQPTFDPSTGFASIDLELSAKSDCRPGWDFDCQLDVLVEEAAGAQTTKTRTISPGERGAVGFDFLPAGAYTWSAKTVERGFESAPSALPLLNGQPHFRVLGPQLLPEQVPPHEPVAVSHLLDWHTGRARLSAISWDLNADPIQLEFEVRDLSESFRGAVTHVTPTSAPDVAGGSIRVFGAVDVPAPEGVVQHFQVRAVDPSGVSDWVDGGEFPDRRDVQLFTIANWNYRVPLRFYMEALGIPELPREPDFEYFDLQRIASPRGLASIEPRAWTLEDVQTQTRAFSEALRTELLPVGVSGVLLEPTLP